MPRREVERAQLAPDRPRRGKRSRRPRERADRRRRRRLYGEWGREIAEVRLVVVPAGRWGNGGKPVGDPAPSVTFAIKEAAFSRPEADGIVAGPISG
ncbi:hypothetical protein [Nonomuraea sp. NPDC049309]|uniref:hypothetical protein n=1 Tax=Nonomuraea sp. NPDC049309 TaxID=3364350 RepID=UPI003713D785